MSLSFYILTLYRDSKGNFLHLHRFARGSRFKHGIDSPHLVDAVFRRYPMRLTRFKAVTQVRELIRELMDRFKVDEFRSIRGTVF